MRSPWRDTPARLTVRLYGQGELLPGAPLPPIEHARVIAMVSIAEDAEIESVLEVEPSMPDGGP